MTLQDYQLSIDTTGLVIGGGTDYIVHGWEGSGLPELRVSDTDRPFDHGIFLGPEYLRERVIAISLTVRGDDAEDAQAKVDALTEAWHFDARAGVAEFEARATLNVKQPGVVERSLRGRPRRASIDISRIVTGKATATLEFVGSDPRWYSVLVNSTPLGIASAASGRSYPRSYDYGYGGGTSGAVAIVNAGNVPTAPVVRLDGPMTNATITNETTGETLTITYTLGSGEYLEIDFVSKTVMLDGVASRYYAKSGSWWELNPGSNSIRVTSGSGTGSASIRWYDAWL